MKTNEERFWSKVHKGDGCWEWIASLGASGYGNFYPRQRGNVAAHRFSWELANGRAPDGYVMHRCDNPKCVRPDHLSVGTHRDNVLDMHAKGRARNGREKLSHNDVREIRRRFDAGENVRAIARDFPVTESVVYHAARRWTWRNV